MKIIDRHGTHRNCKTRFKLLEMANAARHDSDAGMAKMADLMNLLAMMNLLRRIKLIKLIIMC